MKAVLLTAVMACSAPSAWAATDRIRLHVDMKNGAHWHLKTTVMAPLREEILLGASKRSDGTFEQASVVATLADDGSVKARFKLQQVVGPNTPPVIHHQPQLVIRRGKPSVLTEEILGERRLEIRVTADY